MKILYGEDLIKQLRSDSDSISRRLWIAVPYIGGLKSIRKILGNKWIKRSDISIKLIADTKEFKNYNSDAIKTFFEKGEIRHIAGLHAKMYITDNTCLVTSANLTETAFSKRHEIGAFLDAADSTDAIAIFNKWWNSAEIVPSVKLNNFSKGKNVSPEERKGSSLPELYKLPEDPGETTYWLKPFGVTGNVIKEDETFEKLERSLHFSKIRPSGVKLNDVIITYAVGKQKLLSVYEVISEPFFDKSIKQGEEWKKRWPWYVKGRNLTPYFGKHWAKLNITITQLRDQYLKANPSGKITLKGKSLNALNYGKDKLRLNSDFAEFVIQHIKKHIKVPST